MKNNVITILKSIVWCVIMLVFPVLSGVIATVVGMGTVGTAFLQCSFMALSLLIPSFFVLTGKWQIEEIGFGRFDKLSFKRTLYFLPFLLIFVPVALRGFAAPSAQYIFAMFFLYLFVGIAEEVYFRGIIPFILGKNFSLVGIIVLSTLIFGIGHVTSAFTAKGALEIVLTVINALIFGVMAIELFIVTKNLLPGIIIHFLFDFETKVIVLSGKEQLVAECIRGAVMVAIIVWLSFVIAKNKNYYSQK